MKPLQVLFALIARVALLPGLLSPLLHAQGDSYELVTTTGGAEELRNYPLGPIGGQFRITTDAAHARVVSLVAGAPGAVSGLMPGDLILGAFGREFPPAGRTVDGRELGYHYGPTQELGFAIDRAEAADGVIPLSILRPGVGRLQLNVAIPAKGAFGPVYPLASPKYDATYEKAVANIHQHVMGNNGSVGYFTGWAGLALLGHPDWDKSTGERPYRVSINKIRDFVISYFNGTPLTPAEVYLFDGTNNPNNTGGVSGWYVGQYVMFLAEYHARTKTTDDAATVEAVRAALQRGLEQSANSIQWWKQPAHPTIGYSPEGRSVAGMVGHGSVGGDYMHLGWALGINACGTHTFAGFSFARRAGMNMASRPRDGHYFGYSNEQYAALRADPLSPLSRSWQHVNGSYQWVEGIKIVEPQVLFPNDPLAAEKGEYFDPTVQQKFEVQWKWLSRNTAGFSNPADINDGHVCYTVEGWNPGEAVGKTAGTVLGMAMYQADGGVLTSDDADRLARFKNFISRNYIRQQDSHAYCLGAQAQQAFAMPFLSDRQRQFAMENWRFYHALSRTHTDGFQYVRARYTNDNYLDEGFCAAINVALPHGIAHGRYTLVPGFNRDRLVARFDNPDLRWPDLDARYIKTTSRELPMPVSILDGDGRVLDASQHTVEWIKESGLGQVTFGQGRITFSQDGSYRIKLRATRGSQVLEEPIRVVVASLPAPAGYLSGAASHQVFKDIAGGGVSNLVMHWKFPDFPDENRTVYSAETTYRGDNYGSRLSGVIVAPTTGTYRFHIASDDSSQLRINTQGPDGGAGPVVASVSGATGERNFLAQAGQKSVEFQLTEGQAVGFEALHKEGSGGDHLAVGWSINDGPVEVIPGHHLAMPVPATPSMAIVTQPESARGTLGGEVKLSFTTRGPVPAMYQWRRNGQPFGEMTTTPELKLSNLSAGMEGEYDCTYTTVYGSLTTRKVRVVVTDVGQIVSGGLWREMYAGIGGNDVASLTNHAKFPYSADAGEALASLATASLGDSYGQRWSGWITPPSSGNYRFYLASDDDSEIRLSTDDTPAKAVRVHALTGYTGAKQWSARAPGAYIALTGGRKYYIEVLHKEGGGGDHCAVAWQKEGAAAPVNGSGEIPGSVLSYRKGGIYNDTLLTNAAPSFAAASVTLPDAHAGQAYAGHQLADFVFDPNSIDLASLVFTKLSGPSWLQVAADGTLSGTPVAADAGSAEFRVRVTDAGGLQGEAVLSLTVRPPNRAPAFTAATVSAARATAYARYAGQSLRNLVSDADAWDTLTFAKVSGPAWLTVAADGSLSGVPSFADCGPNGFEVRVTDAAGAVVNGNLAIEVAPASFQLTVNGVADTGGGFNGSKGRTITLGADILKGFEVISRVDFLIDGVVAGSDTTHPYGFDWTNVPAGTHTLKAVITTTAAANNVTQESPEATIYIEYPPQVEASVFATASYFPGGTLLGQAVATAAPAGATAPGAPARRIVATGWSLVSGNEDGAFGFSGAGVLTLLKPALLPNPGVRQLVVRATDDTGILGEGILTVVANPPGAPSVTEQRWSSRTVYAGNTWDTTAPVYTGSLATLTSQAEIPEESRRITALLQPKVSGKYQFHLASDDDSRLFLSTDEKPANKVQIAALSGWSNFQSWGTGSRESAPIDLVAGKLYHIEVQHFCNGGNDHVSVGWKGPGDTAVTAIPGSALFPSLTVSGPAWIGLEPPAASATLLAGVPLGCSASVLDGISRIASVDFYVDGVKFGSDSSKPFSQTWVNPVAGTHRLVAKALSSDGTLLAESNVMEVVIGVNQDPAVDADGDGVNTAVELAVGSNPQDAASVPPSIYQGLRAWWRFNEGSGAAVSDSTGRSQSGALAGVPAWSPAGVAGGAHDFNGASHSVDFGTAPALLGTTDFSVAVWVRCSGSTGGFLINQRDATSNGYLGQYAVKVNADGSVGFYVYNSGYQFNINTTAKVNDNRWHSIVAQREGANGRVYIDGILAGTGSGTVQPLNPLKVSIGYDGRDFNAYFKGLIDEARLYDRALSASEVLALHDEPSTTPAPPVFLGSTLVKLPAAVGRPYTASLASDVWDPNLSKGDSLVFTTVSGPSWLTLSPDGTLVGTPTAADLGVNRLTARITDATSRSNEAVIQITVNPANYWNQAAGGSWAGASNWLLGVVPSGIDAFADFSRLDLAAAATVTLDGARTIGSLASGDVTPSHDWVIATGSGGVLTLDVSSGVPAIDVANRTTTVSAVLAGNKGFAKGGLGTLVLSGNNTYTGDTVVNAGTLSLTQNFGSFNASALHGRVIVNAGAVLTMSNNPVGWGGGATEMLVNGGTINGSGGLGAFGVTYSLAGGTIAGSSSLHLGRYGSVDGAINSLSSAGKSVISNSGGIMLRTDSGQTNYTITTAAGTTVDGIDLQFDQGITQNGSASGITKAGPGTLALNGSSAYTGATVVAAGTLLVNGSLASGTSTTVASGATLGGNGTLNGSATINGILSPGHRGAGALTVKGTLALAGTAAMQVVKNGSTASNDQILGASAISAGGTLDVSLLGDDLVEGDSFTLFNVAPTGSFATVKLPPLPSYLSWQQSGNYRTLSVVGDPNRAAQTIQAFAALPSQTYAPGKTLKVVAPVASSGLPVKLSVKSGPATLAGDTLTFTGAGTVVLAANQSGSAGYLAAGEVSTSISVAKATQTIRFDTLPVVSPTPATLTLAATSDSGLPVVFTSSNPSVGTVSGNVVTITGSGITTITASQPGNANYLAAPVVSRILTVTGATTAANADTASAVAARPVAIDVLANDASASGALEIRSVTTPLRGTAVITPIGVTYTAAADFTGADSFSYTVADGAGATATATVTVTVVNPYQGLMAFWRMNEGAGTSTADASGSGRAATVVGSPAWVEGRSGSAFEFASAGNLTATGATTPAAFTLSAWIKPANLSGTKNVLAQNSSFSLNVNGAGLRFTTPGIQDYDTTAVSLAANVWQHVAVTFTPNTTGGLKFYVNGTLRETMNSGGITTSSNAWTVGVNQWGHRFTGVIDDVAIHNRLLGSVEVAMLAASAGYADPLPAIVPNPLAAADTHAVFAVSGAAGQAVRLAVADGSNALRSIEIHNGTAWVAHTADSFTKLNATGGLQVRTANQSSRRFALTVTTGDGSVATGVAALPKLANTLAAFAPIPAQTHAEGRTLAITPPTSSSGLPVVVSVKSGPATISGSTLTLTGPGTVVLAANQAGDDTYLAAAEVTTSFEVLPAVVAPVIVEQPVSQTVKAGDPVTLAVLANGTAPLAYEWRRNGAVLTGAHISGLQTGRIMIQGVSAADAGGYQVTITNAAGTVTSAVATVTVTPATNPFDEWIGGFNLPAGADEGPSGDPDRDGVSNLLEYAFGGDPASGSTAGSPGGLGGAVLVPAADGKLTLAFPVRDDAAARGLTYAVEYSQSLADGWTSVKPAGATESEAAFSPPVQGFRMRTVTLDSGAAKATYLRVKVTRP